MSATLSPTSRTLAALRAQGRRAEVVERWNQYGGTHGTRKDLFNVIDVIALDPVRGVVGVQCCAGSGHAAHVKKLTVEHAQETADWLSTPGTVLEIWSWTKRPLKRGSKALRWTPRVQEITLADLDDMTAVTVEEATDG